MPSNYILLQSIELNASAASVTFSNIPQSGYTDLKVVASLRGTSGFTTMQLYMTFNGSNTGYSARQLYGDGASATSATLSNSGAAISIVNMNTTQSTANTFSSTDIYIPNYTSNAFKSVSADSVTENNGTTALAGLTAGLWSNTASITSITFTNQSADTFVANSTFSLYGLAAVGTTPVIAPKATGGNITNDGTYWIHTFISSGTFTPLASITCDALVVAGGGGGGYDSAGGGGAGGYRTGSSMSLTAINYPIIVGAGGPGSIYYGGTNGLSPFNGSNSSFSTITSTGGGMGANGGETGQAGGSGGGASGGGNYNLNGAGNAGGYTPVEGYAGGQGIVGSSGNRPSGGGGGASQVGYNGSGSTGGAGGDGISNSISGTARYYAGGGGGSVGVSGSAGGAGGLGGGGNGGKSGSTSPTAGTANTGGGGGAGSTNVGGAGGSGVVIIRYAMS